MTFGICGDFRRLDRLETVAKAGADYVELNFSAFDRATDQEILDVKDTLQRLSLPCRSYNLMFPGDMKVTGKTRDFVRIDEYLHRQTERLACLGAKRLVFGSAGARRVDEGNTRENAFLELVELLSLHVAPIMEKAGIVVAVECLSDCQLIHTLGDGAKLVREVNHPHIRLLIDFFHQYQNGEDLQTLLEHGDLISHVHIAENVKRLYPKQGDGTDYTHYFDWLKSFGYTGMVSVEGNIRDEVYFEDCKDALLTLREAAK
ncbi:MAG: sugar phosphate isomerase/epimerase [Clostridia bacterium]|nr:sugar phosphate isomerase/epimerase [Clostridia bacterium]